MVDNKASSEIVEIKVSSRILRHISRGIYRSPAGALKELVSNSYDAGARKVTINTNYPVVDQITVTDNGSGITRKQFLHVIQQIGFSDKNVGDEITMPGTRRKRRTIGHYGIGFLAIGQLAETAIIISKVAGASQGLKATLDFQQFERRIASDGTSGSIARDETLVEAQDREGLGGEKKHFAIGICTLERVEFELSSRNESFTKVELRNIRIDVHNQVLNLNVNKLLPSAEDQKRYSATFADILALLREKEQVGAALKIKDKKVPRLREYFYEKLLWELSVYAPVAYPEISVFKHGGELNHFCNLAKQGDFELIIDGFVLHKPYEKNFWEEKDFGPVIFKWENEKYYKNHRVSAYVIYQPGTMIRPKFMQGVLVRENGVAVGLYDLTFLNYPFNEGSKFNSLTAEIFAEGLAGAMNVDRDSFNQTAEEYVKLTEWFHGKLYDEVFADVSKLQKQKGSPSRTKNKKLVLEVLNHLAKSNGTFNRIKFEALGKKAGRIKRKEKSLILNSDHKDFELSTAKRERLLFAIALIIRGYITPIDFEQVSDEIERSKRVISSS